MITREYLINQWDIVLFVQIFLMVFIVSFFPESWQDDLYLAFYASLYFTTAMELDRYKRTMLGGAFIALITLACARAFQLPVLHALSRAVNVAFFGLIIVFFIRQIAGANTVTKRVILQALNGYMLLGIIFTFLIGLMVQFDPGAFNFPSGGARHPNDLLYYGFVTFATVGYGDFLPLKPHSRSLAILISVSGQMYVAVIIALLVGKFSVQRQK
jgi:voltage-gated potassium channel